MTGKSWGIPHKKYEALKRPLGMGMSAEAESPKVCHTKVAMFGADLGAPTLSALDMTMIFRCSQNREHSVAQGNSYPSIITDNFSRPYTW